jgi:hypothetical protein
MGRSDLARCLWLLNGRGKIQRARLRACFCRVALPPSLAGEQHIIVTWS